MLCWGRTQITEVFVYGRRRQVRCSFCGTAGHNRSGCPTVAERAKDGSSYAAYLLEKKRESSKNRTCSYCRNGGHNRSTCQKLIDDYINKVQQNAEYRKKLLALMKKAGFGIGSLVSNRYGRTPISIVTDIVWDKINIDDDYVDSFILDDDKYPTFAVDLKKFKDNGEQVTYESYCGKLESSISPEQVENQVPADWLSGKSQTLRDKYDIKEKKQQR